MAVIGQAGELELWGGIECTVNRVQNRFFDQLSRTGHETRISDLDAIAELGIKTIRYPVLWEKVAPESEDVRDWNWTDERLNRLRELGIEPIAGLIHHGSGPSYTNLLDPEFPEKLARYAGAVAARYPWLSAYTPVNEPLTTSRFSCLYGHWYPHHCDALSALQALLNQCKGTVLAMREIRKVNPDAKLVQTEDLGFIQSTPKLAYQARFENERRWLTWDLLTGRVDCHHPLWNWMLARGITAEELLWFSENPCAPDIVGVNYYVTSERYLDENRDLYPERAHGGNGKHCYADIETVRVAEATPIGVGEILKQAYSRYKLPLVVTEAHLGCTREEQCRWLRYIWDSANKAAERGVDVRAVTAWSLLGAYDWNSLLTTDEGYYETGAFDVRTGRLRRTALADQIKNLTSGEPLPNRHPGWWERTVRIRFPQDLSGVREGYDEEPNPILIAGGAGTLGAALARTCELRGLPYRCLSRAELNILDPKSVREALRKHRPWAVVNAAGYVKVDEAELDRDACHRVNVTGPSILASECGERGIRMATFSSDLVFDGRLGWAYVESDRPCPINVYGESKAESERQVLDRHPGALVVRTSAFFGPWDTYNFAWAAIRALLEGRSFEAAADQWVSPTYVPDLANWTLDLLIDGVTGIRHLANRCEITWADFAEHLAEKMSLDPGLVHRRSHAELRQLAQRPERSTLASEKGNPMPSLEDAVERYLNEISVRNPLTVRKAINAMAL